MSLIGPSAGVVNLAGSVAGAANRPADPDGQQAEAAQQRFHQDRGDLAARSLGDVAATDGSSDRDADGRLPWSARRRPADTVAEERSSQRAADALAERGGRIDLQA